MTIRKTDPRYKALKRPCKGCGKYFRPSGDFTRFCDKCLKEKRKKVRKGIKERYLKRKNENKIK